MKNTLLAHHSHADLHDILSNVISSLSFELSINQQYDIVSELFGKAFEYYTRVILSDFVRMINNILTKNTDRISDRVRFMSESAHKDDDA